jgi:hypothetical protein
MTFKSVSCWFLLYGTILSNTGCSKLVHVSPPPNGVTGADVFSTDATAAAVLTGIYANMSTPLILSGQINSMSLFPGLAADELSLWPGQTDPMFVQYYSNALSSSNQEGNAFYWNSFYPVIYTANSAIQGLMATSAVTPPVKQQLLGEADFVRAFCYFYLVNLYGDVPIVNETNYTTNESLLRSPKAEVWKQIISDLINAQALLNANYLDGSASVITTERTRPNKATATALLAGRIYILATGQMRRRRRTVLFRTQRHTSFLTV